MPCANCGEIMEKVDEEFVETRDGLWVNEMTYECVGCGDSIVVFDYDDED